MPLSFSAPKEEEGETREGEKEACDEVSLSRSQCTHHTFAFIPSLLSPPPAQTFPHHVLSLLCVCAIEISHEFSLFRLD